MEGKKMNFIKRLINWISKELYTNSDYVNYVVIAPTDSDEPEPPTPE